MSYGIEYESDFRHGFELFGEHVRLKSHFFYSGIYIRIGFIAACIANGVDTEKGILEWVDQVKAPYASFDARQILARGAGLTKKRKLWALGPEGRYKLLPAGEKLVQACKWVDEDEDYAFYGTDSWAILDRNPRSINSQSQFS